MNKKARTVSGTEAIPAPPKSELPQKPVVMATLEIDFDLPAYAPYFQQGREADRAAFEALVWNELAQRVPSNVWILWQSVPLYLAHPLDVQVRDAVVGALKTFNSDPQTQTTLMLTGGNGVATVTSIRYVWRDGRYIRVHGYALDIETQGQGWYITHQPSSGPPVTVLLQARLSWETKV